MAGNVWEWCHDGYEAYNATSVRNLTGAREATDRVFRGGGWFDGDRHCRAAFRRRGRPGFRSEGVGFRVAAVARNKSS
jgi:formylglycine-generating enzyme required for sulfatase activity